MLNKYNTVELEVVRMQPHAFAWYLGLVTLL